MPSFERKALAAIIVSGVLGGYVPTLFDDRGLTWAVTAVCGAFVGAVFFWSTRETP